MKLTRESVGVKNIDSMLEGGVPSESVVGVFGQPGVGKSILAIHFLFQGAREGKKGVYINLEEPRKNVDNMINSFSFAEEFFEYEKKGLIVIKCFTYSEYEQISLDILDKVKKDKKIKRLVIDSFNCFFDSLKEYSSENVTKVRKLVNFSFSCFRREGLNVFLIMEKHEPGFVNLDYNIPYLVDGIINLDFLDLGIIERRVFIPKMRWTNQFKESRSYEIGKNGFEVLEE